MNAPLISYGEQRPHHPLALRYIHSYTYSIGELHEQEARHIIRAVPSVMTQFYFEFCGGLSEIEQGGARSPVTRRSYVNSGLGEWFDIYQIPSNKSVRPIKNFKVDLYPHTLYEVFGLSPGELKGQDLRIEDVWGMQGEILFDELEQAQDGPSMVAAFETHWTRRVLNGRRREVVAFERLVDPVLTLSQLAREVGYSERWLQKRYREVMGVSFKQLQGNRRFLKMFQTLTALARSQTPISLARIAHDHGYFDQAHFIKEFHRYVGMTPSEYLRHTFGGNPAALWEW